jgi:hypothetical protein
MLLAFPPSSNTAHQLARHLRSAGFWTLPPRTWNCAADLVEHLAEAQPSTSQLLWLWRAHESLLASQARGAE